MKWSFGVQRHTLAKSVTEGNSTVMASSNFIFKNNVEGCHSQEGGGCQEVFQKLESLIIRCFRGMGLDSDLSFGGSSSLILLLFLIFSFLFKNFFNKEQITSVNINIK